jgi:signal transduction histidine kinase
MVNREHVAGDPVLVVAGWPGDQASEVVQLLAAEGCAATVASSEAALDLVVARTYLVVILRAAPRAGDDLERVRRLLERAPGLRIAVIGKAGDVTAAVDLMQAQAFDYLEDPVTGTALAALIRRARQTPDPRQAALLESLQILTPGLVHELRNPLSGILAGSQMLARLLGGQGTAFEYAEIVREEAQHLERFLGRLAEFGRLGACGLQCAAEMDLPVLLRRLLDTVTPACAARRIRIVSSFDPRAGAVRGDPGRLSQACAEILQNAQEAMPEGGTLTVGTRRVTEYDTCVPGVGPGDPPGGWIDVEFRDTGSGFTGEARRRVCEPFFSTRPRALGIGLALAQAIACAHGGLLRLGTADHPGGHVVLRLPMTAGGESDALSLPGLQQAQHEREA